MKKTNPLLIDTGAPWLPIYKEIYSLIEDYERIFIVAHTKPDYDALGSAFGLAKTLEDIFPNKEIVVGGEDHNFYSGKLYPKIETKNNEWFSEKFLGIAVDCANSDRLGDKRVLKGDKVIKIDHHPPVEQYGDVNLVIENMISCAEVIVSLLINYEKFEQFTKDAAIFLFSGVAGDSGRFKYANTSAHTFAVAAELLSTGVDLSKDIYEKMYVQTIGDLKLVSYILNNFIITPKGVAYYVIHDEELVKLGVDPNHAKSKVNMFNDLENVHIWFSVNEDKEDGIWRISLRSKHIPINGVAAKYGGGGHDRASGCQINKLSELEQFVQDLEVLI